MKKFILLILLLWIVFMGVIVGIERDLIKKNSIIEGERKKAVAKEKIPDITLWIPDEEKLKNWEPGVYICEKWVKGK